MKNMRPISSALVRDHEAQNIAKLFPRLRKDFNAIAQYREMTQYLNINNRLAKRNSGTFGRKLAHLPRPIFVWLSVKFPEVLRNPQLLKAYLRSNPHLLLIDKSQL